MRSKCERFDVSGLVVKLVCRDLVLEKDHLREEEGEV